MLTVSFFPGKRKRVGRGQGGRGARWAQISVLTEIASAVPCLECPCGAGGAAPAVPNSLGGPFFGGAAERPAQYSKSRMSRLAPVPPKMRIFSRACQYTAVE